MARLLTEVERSNSLLERSDAPPRLRFDLRGRCAGQALPDQWVIRLNTALLRQHGAAFVDETVPHEWAHLLAFKLYGSRIKPHGKEWRGLMRLLGQRPDVCHNYTVQPTRQLRRHPYHCACQDHQLSSIRHRRVRAGQAYVCKQCGELLKPGDANSSAC